MYYSVSDTGITSHLFHSAYATHDNPSSMQDVFPMNVAEGDSAEKEGVFKIV